MKPCGILKEEAAAETGHLRYLNLIFIRFCGLHIPGSYIFAIHLFLDAVTSLGQRAIDEARVIVGLSVE